MSESKQFQNNLNMTPEKAEFFTTVLEELKGKNKNQMLSFLSTINNRASENNIQFNDQETELFVKALTANMSPAERKRVELIRHMSKVIGNKGKKASNESGK